MPSSSRHSALLYAAFAVLLASAHAFGLNDLMDTGGGLLAGYGLGNSHARATRDKNVQIGSSVENQIRGYIRNWEENGGTSHDIEDISFILPDGKTLVLSGKVVASAKEAAPVCAAEVEKLLD